MVLCLLLGALDAWAQGLPTVNITSVDTSSAEAGPDTASFTITRTGGNLAATLTVGISLGGTAGLNIDYTLSPGFVTAATIAAGETSRTVTLTPRADNLVEGPEAATVTLTANPSAYELGGDTHVSIDIADDPVQVTISSSDSLASETTGDPASFTVSRSGGNTNATLTVGISIGGTAGLNIDYTLSPGFVTAATIAAGETSRTVVVTPRTSSSDLPEDEGKETITIGLTASSNYEIQAPGCVTLILDDSLALYKDGFEPPANFPCDN